MRFLRRKHNIKRILYSPLAILVLLVVLGFTARAVWGAYRNEQKSRTELANARLNSKELESRETFLSSEIERLESPRGIEEELRNKYPVAKEGEEVVIIVESGEDKNAQAEPQQKGFWSSFLDIFR
jgi:cell division protein FtsB